MEQIRNLDSVYSVSSEGKFYKNGVVPWQWKGNLDIIIPALHNAAIINHTIEVPTDIFGNIKAKHYSLAFLLNIVL